MDRQEASQSSFPAPSPDTEGPRRDQPCSSEKRLSKEEGAVVPAPTREGEEVVSFFFW